MQMPKMCAASTAVPNTCHGCADEPLNEALEGGSPPGEASHPQSRAVSLAVPLEHQLSSMFPTVLTPSGQVSDLTAIAGVELAPEEAAAEYLGEARLWRCGPGRETGALVPGKWV